MGSNFLTTKIRISKNYYINIRLLIFFVNIREIHGYILIIYIYMKHLSTPRANEI